MTIPFLQVRPKSIKLKVSPRFPAQLIGRNGIDVEKSDGNYYLDLNYSDFPTIGALPPNATYALIFDPVAQKYVQAPLSLFSGAGLTDAPNDGQVYGRQSLAWTVVPAFVDAPNDGHLYGRKSLGWSLAGDMVKSVYDPNTISADAFNSANENFIQAGSGAVYRKSQDKMREVFSVKDFGANGDGITDDTAAIMAAYAALGSTGSGTIVFPPGIYNYTQLTFDHATGLVLRGAGAIYASILRCTVTSGTGGVKLRSTFDCTVEFLHLDHVSGYASYLADARHAPSSGTDTQGLYFNRCTFTSKGNNLYSAFGVSVDQATLVTFDGCKFVSLVRPVDGQNSAGGSYSNGIRFKNCQSFDNTGYFANYLGQAWTFEDCNFQACHDGAQRIVYAQSSTPWLGLVFKNCTAYDATAAGTSYLLLDVGQGLSIIGGMYGGRSDLAASDFLNATGIIQGIHMKGVYLSLFTIALLASVTGNKAWDVDGGNILKTVTTFYSGGSNVSPAPTNALNAIIP